MNSIIWNNSASGISTSTSASVFNNNSTVEFSYSLIANSGGSGGWNGAIGVDNGNNIDADPLFIEDIDLDSVPTTSGNLQLTSMSPAINGGNPDTTGLNLPETDLAGNPRILNDTIDMGAYEYGEVSFGLSGQVATAFGVNVNNVEMVMSGDESQIEFTSPQGLYDFLVEGGNTVTVTPEKDENWLDGVTTFDLILIQRHILFLTLFDNPYKFIAADANGDGNITTFDLVFLQSMIVGNLNAIPGNTSWRFIPGSYDFINPDNPLAENWPESEEYDNVNSDLTEEDWIAMKTGDVSGDAGLSGIRRVAGQYGIATERMDIDHSSEWTIRFSAPTGIDLSGYQMEIRWDPELIAFTGFDLSNTALTHLKDDHFYADSEIGILRTNWWLASGQELNSDDELFQLHFKPLRQGLDPESEVELVQRGSRWHSEAYRTADDGLLNLKLEWKHQSTQEVYILHPNTPNPFRDFTKIRFELARAEEVQLTVWDQRAGLLREVKIQGQKGMNEFLFTTGDLPAGVLYYRVETENWRATAKMITVE